MHLPPQQPNLVPRRIRRRWFIAPLIVLATWGGLYLIGLWEAPITIVNGITGGAISSLFGDENPSLPKLDDDPDYQMPKREANRLDILLLGIRGEDDEENGNYLTDTILLLSIDTTTSDASIVSIPRDLYVRLGDTVSDKINSAYLRLGLSGVQRMFSRVTGVYIDHAVVVDFEAFRTLVDELGGVTVTLEHPFTEAQQWGYEFHLPAGENTLNGEQALYFVRSRYSTSDFDRAWRQQQVMLGLRARAEELGVMSNPIKAVGLFNAVRKHVETDINVLDVGTITELFDLARNTDRIRRYVLTTENLLIETTAGGPYRLLPRGNSLTEIKAFFSALPSRAVLTRATPTPTDIPTQ